MRSRSTAWRADKMLLRRLYPSRAETVAAKGGVVRANYGRRAAAAKGVAQEVAKEVAK